MKKAGKGRGKPNGKAGKFYMNKPASERGIRPTPKKGKGHEGGKRVAALRNRTGTHSLGKQMGEVTITAAMRKTAEELGIEVTTDGKTAIEQLTQLANLNGEVLIAKAEYDEKADRAKVAKKTWESKQEMLSNTLKAFTQPGTPMPLFDAAKAEEEREGMLAADKAAAETTPDDPEKDDDPADAIEPNGVEPPEATT